MQYELFSDTDFQQETPFTGRSVCLLGSFRTASKSLQKKLQALGADVKQGLSRTLHYAVLGSDVPADALDHLQQLAYHGYQPRILSERDLDDIFQGHYAPYKVPAQISKDLHLTLRHYLGSQFRYDGSLNPLYMEELYLAPDTEAPQADLYQMLGNRGVYANAYIDDTTDVLVISDRSLQHLRDGQTDESLRYIEQQYNQSRAQTFRFRMTSEGELLAWLKASPNSLP
ncbi:MAG: hypothetical protein IKP36_03695 [Bacteroidaceae bacterium]|nr:hypothetical protein [Bacteroidaceae bacterium]